MPQTKERLLHHVIVSVFCKAYERQEEVLAGLDTISPIPTAELLKLDKEFDPDRPRTYHYRGKDVTLTVQELESDDGRMQAYTLYFRGLHDTSRFAKLLRESMSPERRAACADDPTMLLDDEGKLVVRFDKRDLMRGKVSLTTTGDCYAIKAAVAAYPKTIERAEEVVRKILA
ncbi:TPA: hypothetical protein HA251_03230 [Candidatus Woesearchaeota archaeon]|nr:hypothetical protein [Candidatus Woesearchaeota archaeon]